MTIVAIIPAYNEEKTISNIIEVLKSVHLIKEIFVVSDGSTDSTVQVAKDSGAKVIELSENLGKGGAMKVGLEQTAGDIILFLDADLIGLTPNHVYDLLYPVLEGHCDMTIGIFAKGRLATDLAQKLAPYLSGQRSVKRELLSNIPDIDISRFGVEVALTKYVEENNISFKEVILSDMTHVMKEEKFGLLKGFAARMKMYWEIVSCLKNK